MRTKTTLLDEIEDRTALIGVIGLNHIGLTLALSLTEQGYTVNGVEDNPIIAHELTNGPRIIPALQSPELLPALQRAIRGDKLQITPILNPSCDLVVSCVSINDYMEITCLKT